MVVFQLLGSVSHQRMLTPICINNENHISVFLKTEWTQKKMEEKEQNKSITGNAVLRIDIEDVASKSDICNYAV